MRRNIYGIKILVAGFMALLILSLIDIGYFYTGIHLDNEQGTTDYIWQSGQLKTCMTEGFAWFRMDDAGYNNSNENYNRAMQDGVDILLMGSSHMESIEVPQNKNVAAILNDRLPEKRTYNLGISGHDIYRVVDNVDHAINKYHPKEYLLIETSTVELVMEEMQAVIDGSAQKIPSYDSGLIYYMQKIPAIKWIYKGIDDWKNQSRISDAVDIRIDSAQDMAGSQTIEISTDFDYSGTLSEFLKIISDTCKDNGCTPIIFYHPTAVISEEGSISFPTDDDSLKTFTEACEKNGIVFLDMTESFYENYNENYTLPHGFINSYVGSGHLNTTGHELIACQLIEYIETNTEEIH